MKTRWVFFFVALLMLAPPCFGAESLPYKKLYLGVGGTFNLELLDVNQLVERIKHDRDEIDPKDAVGFNLKFGFMLNEFFSAEGAFDYVHSFSWEGTYDFQGKKTTSKIDTKVQTYTLSLRMHPPIGKQRWFRPYLLVGAGLMLGKVDGEIHNSNGKQYQSNTEDHPCGKLAAGVDWFWNESLSIGTEGAYVWGFQELDEVNYAQAIVNVTLHFD